MTINLLMSDFKVSQNKTGTLFYTRPVQNSNKPYRVRFKSFQQGLFDNHNVIDDLDHMQFNYNVFKNKKGSCKRQSRSINTVQPPPKLYKNMKERSKDGDELKRRLRSMRQTRRFIFDQIKKLND